MFNLAFLIQLKEKIIGGWEFRSKNLPAYVDYSTHPLLFSFTFFYTFKTIILSLLRDHSVHSIPTSCNHVAFRPPFLEFSYQWTIGSGVLGCYSQVTVIRTVRITFVLLSHLSALALVLSSNEDIGLSSLSSVCCLLMMFDLLSSFLLMMIYLYSSSLLLTRL